MMNICHNGSFKSTIKLIINNTYQYFTNMYVENKMIDPNLSKHKQCKFEYELCALMYRHFVFRYKDYCRVLKSFLYLSFGT